MLKKKNISGDKPSDLKNIFFTGELFLDRCEMSQKKFRRKTIFATFETFFFFSWETKW